MSHTTLRISLSLVRCLVLLLLTAEILFDKNRKGNITESVLVRMHETDLAAF